MYRWFANFLVFRLIARSAHARWKKEGERGKKRRFAHAVEESVEHVCRYISVFFGHDATVLFVSRVIRGT